MAIEAIENQGNEKHHGKCDPVDIIGLSYRFSGMADTPGAFWQMLSKGMTSWSRDARDRFNLESFWHPRSDLPGSFNASRLHLLRQNPAVFDNDFFSISGLEAKAMDPQQRLMLELAYETFENAGLTMEVLEKSKTGVYCASTYQDYDQILGRDPELSAKHRFTGTGTSMLADRISYFFDLRGPSMTIDKACSSTLVALNEACSALRMGEIDQALVGGVNLILDPDKPMVQSSMPSGEGMAGIMFKPLSTVLRNGDPIRAIVHGTSVVSDGRTPGITMPRMDSQVEAITKVYKQAGLTLADTTYIEAHGTIVGDKAEALAFATTMGKDHTEQVIVGSVKSNLGHIENASGLASVIKTVLMMENGAIPPVLRQ
ncbi:hypothetical protein GGP41_002703 [Bipolaris sorokiniana]|uniref:Ketosynthase family 3 (KS3) domain-containing protein n=1 Tax=Cochliobolus sativus TaxID=45130 RepID=A0A8H6DWG7_COCSA|nr:hypothetical protein GGP41_002703 [Bipolaris sorokiniana]